MDTHSSQLADMQQQDKLQLLEWLLNDLHQQGLVSRDSLMQVASDVMLLEYREDEDLLCFQCLPEESEEE